MTKKNFPYRTLWQTGDMSNGNYNLTVVATDKLGNKYESPQIKVIVNN
jgi:hypothetical protein